MAMIFKLQTKLSKPISDTSYCSLLSYARKQLRSSMLQTTSVSVSKQFPLLKYILCTAGRKQTLEDRVEIVTLGWALSCWAADTKALQFETLVELHILFLQSDYRYWKESEVYCKGYKIWMICSKVTDGSMILTSSLEQLNEIYIYFPFIYTFPL